MRSHSEMTDQLSKLVSNLNISQKTSETGLEREKELVASVTRLENEKRLLDLECSEKSLRDKEDHAETVTKLSEEKSALVESWKKQLRLQLSRLSNRMSAPGFPPRTEGLLPKIQDNYQNCDKRPLASAQVSKMDELSFRYVPRVVCKGLQLKKIFFILKQLLK